MLGKLRKVLKKIFKKKASKRNLTMNPCSMDKALGLFKNITAYGAEYIELGANVSFNDYCHLTANKNGNIKIGNDVLIGPYVIMNTGDHLYKDPLTKIRDQGHVYEDITIGSDVWIGARVTILRGSCICDGCVIAADSLINRNTKTEVNGVYAGIQARLISIRSKEESL